MYKRYMKNVLYLAAEASVFGQTLFFPLFANVIKNKITSSKTHMDVCLWRPDSE